ncbi:MAG: hypothetical protein AAF515_19805 [Pseudomonadota bacterium]
MTRVVFHIGLHKTATTSLQVDTFPTLSGINYLGPGHPAVAHYVNTVIARDPIHHGAFPIKTQPTGVATAAGAADDAPPVDQQAVTALREALQTGETNLVSSEALSGPAWVGVTQRGIDHRTPVLLNLLQDFPDAELLLIIRRQDDYAKSMYRQYVKSGGTRPLAQFLGANGHTPLFAPDRYRYAALVDALQRSFARVRVIPFELLRENEGQFLGTVSDFLGAPPPDKPMSRRNSTRMGSAGLNLCRVLNRLFTSPLNPAGVLPGIPIRRGGGWRTLSPVALLQDHWPSTRAKTSAAHQALFATVLAEANSDNRRLEALIDQDLARYGY